LPGTTDIEGDTVTTMITINPLSPTLITVSGNTFTIATVPWT